MAESWLQSIGRALRSPAFKLVLIGILVLLLGIPLALVWTLVAEREGRSFEVRNEVARTWGAQQSLGGPFLIVPYVARVTSLVGDKQTDHNEDRLAVFLPERLDVQTRTTSQVLHRSIYEVPVYSSEMTVSGHFGAPDMSKVASDAVAVRWGETILALGITDVSGLKQASVVKLGATDELAFEPSIGIAASSMSGIHARLSDAKHAGAGAVAASGSGAATSSAPAPFDFSFSLALSGSSSVSFTPVARETEVSVASDWPSPSFNGAFLPVERKIDAHGFTASWHVPHLARSVPQEWSMTAPELSLGRLDSYQFGANLYVPVDFYDLVSRAIKYGLLFPAVSFMAVLIMEVLTRRRLHPVQYAFAGVALVLFFVLLLSFSEHIGFAPAYLLSALATSGMLAAYVWRAMESVAKGLVMLAVLLILYGLLYLILRLEDYALLAGSVAGFALLTAAMFLTLGVDWSDSGRLAEQDSK